ncbi:hypothetical protein HDU76_001660 [Blyttiomyces sp. JEL0837]|nr:hypothetical protein HDU76_001660 [Blyttiomyces sp. JEL0837]
MQLRRRSSVRESATGEASGHSRNTSATRTSTQTTITKSSNNRTSLDGDQPRKRSSSRIQKQQQPQSAYEDDDDSVSAMDVDDDNTSEEPDPEPKTKTRSRSRSESTQRPNATTSKTTSVTDSSTPPLASTTQDQEILKATSSQRGRNGTAGSLEMNSEGPSADNAGSGAVVARRSSRQIKQPGWMADSIVEGPTVKSLRVMPETSSSAASLETASQSESESENGEEDEDMGFDDDGDEMEVDDDGSDDDSEGSKANENDRKRMKDRLSKNGAKVDEGSGVRTRSQKGQNTGSNGFNKVEGTESDRRAQVRRGKSQADVETNSTKSGTVTPPTQTPPSEAENSETVEQPDDSGSFNNTDEKPEKKEVSGKKRRLESADGENESERNEMNEKGEGMDDEEMEAEKEGSSVKDKGKGKETEKKPVAPTLTEQSSTRTRIPSLRDRAKIGAGVPPAKPVITIAAAYVKGKQKPYDEDWMAAVIPPLQQPYRPPVPRFPATSATAMPTPTTGSSAPLISPISSVTSMPLSLPSQMFSKPNSSLSKSLESLDQAGNNEKGRDGSVPSPPSPSLSTSSSPRSSPIPTASATKQNQRPQLFSRTQSQSQSKEFIFQPPQQQPQPQQQWQQQQQQQQQRQQQNESQPLSDAELEKVLLPQPFWLPWELEAFERGLREVGKAFTQISREFVPSRTTDECVQAYYRYKHSNLLYTTSASTFPGAGNGNGNGGGNKTDVKKRRK